MHISTLRPESAGYTLFIKRRNDKGEYIPGLEKHIVINGDHLFEEVVKLTSHGQAEAIALHANGVPLLHFSYCGLFDPFFRIH